MKRNLLILSIVLIFETLQGCCPSIRDLTSDASQWSFKGDAVLRNDTLRLSGAGSCALLTHGDYTDFVLTADLCTSPQARGTLLFHTDSLLQKGYRVAIDNTPSDSIWWRKTGSLTAVRNLTKSFATDGQWATLRVVVSGHSICIDIDSVRVVEYVEPQNPYRDQAHHAMRLGHGTFAMVSDGAGSILCRNMRVQPMHCKAKADTLRGRDEQNDPIIRLHQADFPVLDYHVHLKGGLTKERAAAQSRETGINYAVAPNCGISFPVQSDRQVRDYLDSMRTQPFMLAMQAEGREWTATFSREACNRFDYVFTDALTFRDDKGRRTRLWKPEEVWIDGDEEHYMDLIVDRICNVLKEPADIYVNPCFLPAPMDKRYDELWTPERIDRVVKALADNHKALEINELYQIPSLAILLKAKQAGIKFTFGSNNVTPNVSDLGYSIRMKEACGLTVQDMYNPYAKQR